MTGDLDPRTIRLSEDEWDELDEEAESQGFENRTEYVRFLIRNRDQLVGGHGDKIEELEGKIEELEEQVENLESVREMHGEWLEENEERIDRLWREVIA